MSKLTNDDVQNVIEQATEGAIIRSSHIDTLGYHLLHQRKVETGSELPSASGYAEGDIFSVQGEYTYKHNGNTWIKLIEDSGVKVYRALLNQSGTGVPTAVVLENSLGFDISYTRDDSGSYDAVPSGGNTFNLNKTIAKMTYEEAQDADTPKNGHVTVFSGNIRIYTYNVSAGNPEDGCLMKRPFEIIIYP